MKIKKKRGVSVLIATVLLILIVVAAAGIIWAVVVPMMQQAMQLKQACMKAILRIDPENTCINETKKILEVAVERGSEEFVIEEIAFSIGWDGKAKSVFSSSEEVINAVRAEDLKKILRPLEKYTFKLNLGKIGIDETRESQTSKIISLPVLEDVYTTSSTVPTFQPGPIPTGPTLQPGHIPTDYRSYLKFNLSSIPAGSTIDNAIVYLWAYSYYSGGVMPPPTSTTIEAQNCSDITWTETSANTIFQDMACSFQNATLVDGINKWFSWNVTSGLRSAYNSGFQNFTIRLNDTGVSTVASVINTNTLYVGTSSGYDLGMPYIYFLFNSSEATANTPYLYVNYTSVSPVSLAYKITSVSVAPRVRVGKAIRTCDVTSKIEKILPCM